MCRWIKSQTQWGSFSKRAYPFKELTSNYSPDKVPKEGLSCKVVSRKQFLHNADLRKETWKISHNTGLRQAVCGAFATCCADMPWLYAHRCTMLSTCMSHVTHVHESCLKLCTPTDMCTHPHAWIKICAYTIVAGLIPRSTNSSVSAHIDCAWRAAIASVVVAVITLLAKIHHAVAAFLNTAYSAAVITINHIACACECFMSHVWIKICHTSARVTANIWISHMTRQYESCHTYEWNLKVSCHACQRVMPQTWVFGDARISMRLEWHM